MSKAMHEFILFVLSCRFKVERTW